MAKPERDLACLLEGRKLVVVGGVGGVGKTTISAAIALQAALDGKRVAVLTIDPARRLGTALGFRTLGNQLKKTPDSKLDPWRTRPGGSLSAAMLDVKATFDDVVGRYAPSPAVRDRILANRFYDHLSEALSGTHEYMALEKIYEIQHSGEFDLLVLDTPPASALTDFLKAPERLRAFLNKDVVRWFFAKESKGLLGLAGATLGKGVGWALSILDRLAGGRVLEDVADLLRDFQGLFEGLRARATTVEGLLQDSSTLFLLVTTLDPLPLQEVVQMAESLQASRLHVGGVIFNRILPGSRGARRADAFGQKLSTRANELLKRQANRMEQLPETFAGPPRFQISLCEGDPSTLNDLANLRIEKHKN